MWSQIKPIKVWGKGGPNPPKVAIVLEELGLPYEAVAIQFADVKKPDYLAINPNGRLPAIYDPNTDLTLWESGAIIEYLIERYDTTHKLSFAPGTAESYHAKQWLFFQTTGQGPYYGQARYTKEISRVTGVLEGHLARQKVDADSDGPWLVGNKFSYADISFIPCRIMTTRIIGRDEYNPDNFPHMTSRKSVKEVLESRERLE
ncbi:glutathione S-transferase Ure2-like protein [Lipomyces starkeyi]